jgi:hypothetical protein
MQHADVASPRSGRQHLLERSFGKLHASRIITNSTISVARYAGLGVVALHTQGSRTRPGLHAVARYAGLAGRLPCLPRARVNPLHLLFARTTIARERFRRFCQKGPSRRSISYK